MFVGVAPESTDPFIPEQHALDAACPIRLHMTREKFGKDCEFAKFLKADVDAVHPDLFVKPVQHTDVCLVHETRKEAISCTYRSAHDRMKLFRLGGPECNTGSWALGYGSHGELPVKASDAGFIGSYLKIKI